MLHRTLQITTGVLMGLAVVAVLAWAGLIGPADPPAAPSHEIPLVPFAAPPLALQSVGGTPFDLSELRGDVVLVFFGFANCPDVCPATLAYWSRALEELEAQDLTFTGVFVSVDPERDTPEALERWMTHYHPDLIALTGQPDEIEAAADAWNVYVSIRPGATAGAVAGAADLPGAEDPQDATDAPDATDREATDPHAGHFGGEGTEGVPSPSQSGPQVDPSASYMVDHSSRTFVVDREGQVVRTLLPYIDGPEIADLLLPLLSP